MIYDPLASTNIHKYISQFNEYRQHLEILAIIYCCWNFEVIDFVSNCHKTIKAIKKCIAVRLPFVDGWLISRSKWGIKIVGT